READLRTLTKLHESWTRAFELTRSADSPASVIERAQGTLAAIDAPRPAIDQRHAKALVLQDAASRSLQTCDDAVARIDDARREAIERIFVQQEPPVWSGGTSLDTDAGGQHRADRKGVGWGKG